MLARGFDNEPLLWDVLEAIKTRVLQDLKHKARIEVKKGVFLYGVADEFGVSRLVSDSLSVDERRS